MIVVIIIVLVLSVFFYLKGRYIKRLRNIRDDFDFTTPEGRALINAYNTKIDTLNGYRLWKKN
jgi:hypothetical protein